MGYLIGLEGLKLGSPIDPWRSKLGYLIGSWWYRILGRFVGAYWELLGLTFFHPRVAPGCPQDAHRRPKTPPRWFQEARTTAQDAFRSEGGKAIRSGPPSRFRFWSVFWMDFGRCSSGFGMVLRMILEAWGSIFRRFQGALLKPEETTRNHRIKNTTSQEKHIRHMIRRPNTSFGSIFRAPK